jgi:hypothetical protein
VLLVGLGSIGFEVFRELLRQLHFISPSALNICLPEIITIDINDEIENKINQSMPFLQSDQDIRPHINWSHKTEDILNWTYGDYLLKRGKYGFSNVFVVIGSEIRNLSIARKIAAWEQLARASHPSTFLLPCEAIGIAYEKDTENWLEESKQDEFSKRDKLSAALNVQIFSMTSVYTKEAMEWRDKLKDLAIAIDSCYNKIFENNSTVLNKNSEHLKAAIPLSNEEGYFVGCMEPQSVTDDKWCFKAEYDRRSSLAQARHIEIKLAQLGYTLSLDESSDWSDKQKEFRNIISQKLALLAECEHRRWNTALLLENYVMPESIPDEKLYDKTRRTAGVNLNLVTFEHLDSKIRGYDYALVYNLPEIIESAEMQVKPLF